MPLARTGWDLPLCPTHGRENTTAGGKKELSLTTEQLNQARASAWHQAGNPLLTADDAAAWLRETGVALFLPRAQQLATAAPSFVEATLGAADLTPAREATENASSLLERLLESGDAIALNLLGTPGEQPDFLATVETLPFLFALLGDKEWKRGPRGKSSPLVIEVWKLLEREGPLTAIEIKEQLGRQLTEAAALRALGDLWLHLRVEPVLQTGEPATWQLLERRRQKQMQAGSTMSQAVALSALVSLYLQSTVAASGEEIEIFLSPIASRSKVREVVRGLTATRQLSTLNLGPVEMYHVEGSLPEFPEVARPEGAVVEFSETAEEAGGMGEGRKRFVAKRLAAEAGEPASERRPDRASGTSRAAGKSGFGTPKPAAKRIGVDRAKSDRPRTERPAAGRPNPGRPSIGASGATEASGADRRPFAPRPGTSSGAGERRPYGMRKPDGGSSFLPREPWNEDRKPEAPAAERERGRPRREAPGQGKAFTPRRDGEPRPFAAKSDRPAGKSFGERKPFAAREGAERKPFTPSRDGEPKPFAAKSDRPAGKSFGERKSFGDRKPFVAREGGERKPFTAREGREHTSFPARSGDRPFKARSDVRPAAGDSRKPFSPRQGGERKPFAAREGGERKPFTPREGGERRSFSPREGGGGAASGARRPSSTGDGARPFKPRADGKPFGDRRSPADRKPFAAGKGAERRPADRPAGGRSFKPRDSGRKNFGDRKQFSPREGGERKPFSPREGGERKSFSPREGGEKSFRPRAGSAPDTRPGSGRAGGGRSERKPFSARPAGAKSSFKPRVNDGPPRAPRAGSAEGAREGGRPRFGASRPPSAGAKRTSGARKTTGAGSGPSRARTSPVTSSGKPRSGVKPPSGRSAGRPGLRAGRSAGGIKRTGRPGKGRSK